MCDCSYIARKETPNFVETSNRCRCQNVFSPLGLRGRLKIFLVLPVALKNSRGQCSCTCTFIQVLGVPFCRYQPSFHGVDLCSLRDAAVQEYFKQPVVVSSSLPLSKSLMKSWIHIFMVGNSEWWHSRCAFLNWEGRNRRALLDASGSFLLFYREIASFYQSGNSPAIWSEIPEDKSSISRSLYLLNGKPLKFFFWKLCISCFQDTFDIRICLAKSQKHTVDFQTAHETDLHNIQIPLNFTMQQSGNVHGLAFWFDVAFIGSQ